MSEKDDKIDRLIDDAIKKETSVYDKNTKEQYEALGRFVVSFEGMVNQVRELCVYLLAYQKGLIFNAPYSPRQKFVSVAMNHQSMTAKPLFEILRCLIAEIAKDKEARKTFNIDNELQNLLSGVMAVINKEYSELANVRNNLLHGTWHIGTSGFSDPDASEFVVNKLSTTKAGLDVMKLPKTAKELAAFTKRCRKTRSWIFYITAGFYSFERAQRLKALFRHNRTNWVHITLNGGEETLP